MPPRKRTEPKPGSGEPEAPAAEQPRQVPEGIPDAEMWEALTAPFPSDWVEKLPKPLKRNDDNKGRCEKPNDSRPECYYSADGHHCGGWHSRAVHLDYVGHAGITMRLNSVLGPTGWDFRPLAVTPDGVPILTRDMFWGQLTIRDHAVVEVAANFNSPQEAYGDALRRCAMRFGVGTYLWSKSDKALATAASADAPPAPAVPTGGGNHESDPNTYAPNGQTWMTPDGKPNPDALADHQRRVFDTIGALQGDEAGRYNAWHQAEKLPQIRAMDEWQAASAMSYLEELVGQRPPA